MTYNISNSALSTTQCSTRNLLARVHRLTTLDEKGHRTAGSAAHVALAEFFRGASKATALAAFEREFRAFSDEHLAPIEFRGRDGQPHLAKNRLRWENTSVILDEWMERNPVASLPFEINPKLVEIPFELSLDKAGEFKLRGIIDAVVRDKTTKRLAVLDHKTSGRLNAQWWGKWRLEAELTEYAWAAAEQLGEPMWNPHGQTQVLDILVNGVEFGELPSDPKRKCPSHGVVYAECAREHVNFGLQPYSRTREAVNAWGKTALKLARTSRDLAASYPAIDDIARAPIEGAFYGSCMFCDYADFCAAGRPTHLATTMLVPMAPSPFDRLKKEN